MRYPTVALILATLAVPASAQEAYTAKSLFFSANDAVVAVGTGHKPAGDSTAVAATQPASDTSPSVVKVSHKKRTAQLGASYFIRLKGDDGTTRDVLTRRIFKSGEKFQLGVRVNRPSYVYILNEAPDGTVTQIYPQPSQANFIDAMGVVFFPAKGSFQFDDNPGMEKLLVFLSSEPAHGDITRRLSGVAPDVVANPVAQTTADSGVCLSAGATVAAASAADAIAPLQLASASTDYAAKGIAFAPESAGACPGQVAQAGSTTYVSKGIVFSDDASPSAGEHPASYVVKQTTKPNSTLFLKINLAHE
jgi:Domain of unknown function (DUF4384)